MIEIRPAEEKDLNGMMIVVEEARAYFKEHGIPQWQEPHPGETHLYPGRPDLLKDIAKGGSYVMVEGDEVAGLCGIAFAADPNYTVIDNGAWLNDHPYGVIHRIAVKADRKGQGLAKQFFRFAETLAAEHGIHDLRGDTHELNQSMRRLFTSMGYTECGTVYMVDGAPRVAYHKVLDDLG
ncbi:MAG: GNAT family N-acetyltransferase [Solobacterium sp.]|nr:GNAT family N-acetyltransferase [Solobacterium sp.]